MSAPRTVAALLQNLLRDPGRPRLTWYGPEGERIELSAAVLDNWVAKTTNLLVEEFDAGPDSTVGLDLPTHWRGILWALATWRSGATLTTSTLERVDVLVTDRPDRSTDADALVAVALPALARTWTGEPLPAGAVDAAQAVMTYGDVIGWTPPLDPDAPALVTDDRNLTHRELIASAGDAPERARVLLTDDDPVAALLAALAVLAADGSVVLAPGLDGARLERIVDTEQVTRRGV